MNPGGEFPGLQGDDIDMNKLSQTFITNYKHVASFTLYDFFYGMS